MRERILEVCVDSAASALAAQAGGASRLELCSNLVIGGTTPGIALFEEVKKRTNLPIHVLIRPRFGDFCYDRWEYDQIRREVAMFRDANAAAVVIGCLTPDGRLERERMKELIELARPAKVTLHRAFDVCRDAWEALELCEELGVDTILTSGQQNSCKKGMELIDQLCRRAQSMKHPIEIMAGAGIHAAVIQTFLEHTGVTAFHMSGKKVTDSRMTYRKEGIWMGLPGLSEFEIWKTDEREVGRAAEVLFGTTKETTSAQTDL